MSEVTQHHSHKKLYFTVFASLAILTVIELIIPDMKLPYAIHASSLTFLAIVKAFLVAYFFMHLNEETKWLKFIAIIPVTAGLYALMVCIETLAR